MKIGGRKCAVPTYSGRLVDILDPDPTTIDIHDIAHHLAKINRYLGATVAPYSVAEHSVRLALIIGSEFLGEALMHDSPEYVLHDISAVIKLSGLIPGYAKLEDTVHKAIWDKFELNKLVNIGRWDKALAVVEYESGLFRHPENLPQLYQDNKSIMEIVPTIKRGLQCYPECDEWGWRWQKAYDMFMGVARRAGLTRI